jgi:signal transduction histidine kinase
MGMSPDVQKRIFEPFYTTKPASVGTGLGLSVSYGIIQGHGGSIAVHSVPGNGTAFDIVLPILASDADPALVRSE